MANKMKIVGVGCGHILSSWLEYVTRQRDLEVVALVDLKEDNARAMQARWNLKNIQIGSDLNTMLKVTQPDLVIDCTVPKAHMDVTLTALKHGCHVYGEKPMSDSMENARRMVAAAKKADRVYAVMQNRRFTPGIRSFQKLVGGGKLGELTTLHSSFFIGAHFWTFQSKMRHPLLLDMAIHTFDEARFISGAEAVSVYAVDWKPKGCWFEHEASATCIFEMSNGVIFTYRGSWCSEGFNTAWDGEWQAIGTKGTARWDGLKDVRGQVAKKVPNGTPAQGIFSTLADVQAPAAGLSLEYHSAWLAHAFGCLRKGTHPETHCEDNIKSLAMVFAAIESSEKRKAVRLK